MFEKEAEEIANKKLCSERICYNHCNFNSPKHHRCGEWHRIYDCAKESAEFGYNKAFVEADKNLKAIVTDFNKVNEWHKSDIPTSQINKVVLGYIKDYNSKMFCLVKWNGEWWYDARTYNDRVKLIAWKEIVLPKEIKEND